MKGARNEGNRLFEAFVSCLDLFPLQVGWQGVGVVACLAQCIF